MNSIKKFKGFTLVELIVVVAIITVLAGIGNITVQAFVRNARRETANDRAHLVFTGFQDIVTQAEIKQDLKLFNAEPATGTLKHAVITFTMLNGDVANTGLNVRSGYSGVSGEKIATWTKGSTEAAYSGASVTKGQMYDKLRAEILNIVDTTMEGSFRVYVDLENYEVKSVIHETMTNNAMYTLVIREDVYKKYGGWYYGLDNAEQEENLWSGKKSVSTAGEVPAENVHCGVYPYQKDVT